VRKNNWVFLFILIVLVGVILLPQHNSEVESTTREITINADRYAFDSSVIRVNRGDKIFLTLNSMDVVHGFYLDGYGIQQEFVPGISEVVEFTADREGKFRFRCSTVCGELHPFMIGEFIVQPNSPFQLSVKISGLVLILTLLYFRISINYQEDQIKIG